MENQTSETKIKIWRLQQGFTVQEGAEFLGISKSYMSMLESGDRKPSREKAIHIQSKTNGQVPFQDWQ